ncbi:KH domain-containing protein [Ihubacter sp. rT4E-8]|uniref:KH domain-containing protein n=1 Tax=unclassified Ihubacter TaxID=2633299 RepID=UPI00137ABF5A
MTKLVESIAKSLVDHPDQVVVTEETDKHGSVLQLQVAAEDMGKVIGKQGRIAKALRTVVKAAATKENKKVVVEIVSEDE